MNRALLAACALLCGVLLLTTQPRRSWGQALGVGLAAYAVGTAAAALF